MAGKKQRKSRTSSGKHKRSKIHRACKALERKMKRWNKYKQEVADGTRVGDQKRWDTSGLSKHLNMLRGLIK